MALCFACVQCLAPGSYPSSEAALHSQPKRFRQCLEAALLRSVLLIQAEVEAKGWASDAVVQLLQQASSKGALHVAGRQVTIDSRSGPLCSGWVSGQGCQCAG